MRPKAKSATYRSPAPLIAIPYGIPRRRLLVLTVVSVFPSGPLAERIDGAPAAALTIYSFLSSPETAKPSGVLTRGARRCGQRVDHARARRTDRVYGRGVKNRAAGAPQFDSPGAKSGIGRLLLQRTPGRERDWTARWRRHCFHPYIFRWLQVPPSSTTSVLVSPSETNLNPLTVTGALNS